MPSPKTRAQRPRRRRLPLKPPASVGMSPSAACLRCGGSGIGGSNRPEPLGKSVGELSSMAFLRDLGA
jgi:hypothetical protein